MPDAAGGNTSSRQPCHSFQRQTWQGSTTLPSFTGSHRRTSSKLHLLLAITRIATLTAAMTPSWTPCYSQLAKTQHYITTSVTNISDFAKQPVATVRLSEDNERQPVTATHLLPVLPVHRPVTAVVRATWRSLDCNPKVEIHLRPHGLMPHTHFTNRLQTDTQRPAATPGPRRTDYSLPYADLRHHYVAPNHSDITISEINISETTKQPVATVRLSEDKERQLITAIHRLPVLPVHSPEPAVAHTTWRPRDCIPKVEIHLRPYGIMPHTHFSNLLQTVTPREAVTPGLLQHQPHPSVRRSTTFAHHTELLHSSQNTATPITSINMHYMHYIHSNLM